MAYTITAASIPTNFRGTPQELMEAFLDRLEITSDVVGFILSDSEPDAPPLSGPSVWLKNGKQIWVWDEEMDGGSFVPLDVSASVTPQIWVGPGTVDPVTPDTALYSIWLKVVDAAVVGLFYWNGTEWVSQPITIEDGSITTAMLQDSSVTTNKVRNGAVTTIKLAGNIPMSKFENGDANLYVRMNTAGTEAGWRAADALPSTILASALIPLSDVIGSNPSDYRKWVVPHTLGVVPRYAAAVFRCKTAQYGYHPGDETEIIEELFIARTTTNLTVMVQDDEWHVVSLSDVTPPIGDLNGYLIENARWELKVYYSKGTP